MVKGTPTDVTDCYQSSVSPQLTLDSKDKEGSVFSQAIPFGLEEALVVSLAWLMGRTLSKVSTYS